MIKVKLSTHGQKTRSEHFRNSRACGALTFSCGQYLPAVVRGNETLGGQDFSMRKVSGFLAKYEPTEGLADSFNQGE